MNSEGHMIILKAMDFFDPQSIVIVCFTFCSVQFLVVDSFGLNNSTAEIITGRST